MVKGVIMAEYIISTCSTADIPEETFNQYDIVCVPFNFYIDDVPYKDDLGKSISNEEFYERLDKGADVKSSQVSVGEYTEIFEKYLKEGKDILHLALDTGISGTYQSAMIAKQDLEEKYPDRKIIVVDTLAASGGLGMFAETVSELRAAGKTIEEAAQWAEDNKKRCHTWFCTTSLKQFIKGGRVSKTAGLVGGMLNICPVLNVNVEGKLEPRGKVKGIKKAFKALVDFMEEWTEEGTNYDQKVVVSHSGCLKDAEYTVGLLEERFPNIKGKVQITQVGTTIGCHTGRGTVVLSFWGKEKID